MRIVIDLQGVQSDSRYRGIGRYSLSLALAMARLAGPHEIWLVLNGALPESIPAIRLAFRSLVPAERIRVYDLPIPVAEHDGANAWRGSAAALMREQFLHQLRPDVVHVASLFENPGQDTVASIGRLVQDDKTAVTLYDLIPMVNAQVYLPNQVLKDWYFSKIEALKQARLVLAISEYTRDEAIQLLGIAPERVVNISAAIDARFRPEQLSQEQAQRLRDRYAIKRDMVMYAPGGFDVRKNFSRLIHAYAMLPKALRASHQLVIVSKVGDADRHELQRLRQQAGLAEDELVLTGYVSDPDLVSLYNLAKLFVFASTQEGFGLPALEAMSCGAPTIGANATSVPEVIGWPQALFDPLSIGSIADKMAQMLLDAELRARLREHGLQQAAKFTWEAAAKRALQAFEAMHAQAAAPSGDAAPSPDQLIAALAAIRATPAASNDDMVRVARSMAFNSAASAPRQLLLDVSTIVHSDAKSGIQRVVRSILVQLLDSPPAGYAVGAVYYDNHSRLYRYAHRFVHRLRHAEAAGVQAPATDPVAEFNQDDIYLSLDLNMHLVRELHALHAHWQCLGVHMFYVVYDILLVQRPDWASDGAAAMFASWLGSITQTATGLLCISASVADDVRHWIDGQPATDVPAPALSSFHLGADLENSLPSRGMPDDAAATLAALRAHKSFLMVGTIEPRKGQQQALAAFELHWQRGGDSALVIVGKQGWKMEGLAAKLRAHPQLGRRLFWLEGISDAYLTQVYAASVCLLAPSEGEGFGLPLIEAAQHELPILARDLPIFREVAGAHAWYFDGLSAAALADALDAWLALHARGQAPASNGMPYLTWSQSAQQLLAALFSITPGAALPKEGR